MKKTPNDLMKFVERQSVDHNRLKVLVIAFKTEPMKMTKKNLVELVTRSIENPASFELILQKITQEQTALTKLSKHVVYEDAIPAWINKKNKAFGNRTPLDVWLNGQKDQIEIMVAGMSGDICG